MKERYVFEPECADDKGRNDIISIYEHPEEGTKYTIGVDAATGFGADYTSIQVWSNRVPFEQVAWFRNKDVNTVVGSEVMIFLARYYNRAFIVPEVRFPGNAYVDNALERYAYGNIFKRKQVLDEAPTVSSKYGISTTEADKHLFINQSKALMENLNGPQLIFHDGITLYEFCNFVYIEDKSKTGAGESFFDDTVIATMLALHGCSLRPQAPRPEKRKFNLEDENTAHMEYLMKRHFARLTKGKEVQRI